MPELSLIPVDHNPFNPMDEVASMPTSNPIASVVGGALHSLATLPQRAIENSQNSLDTGNYDPGPTLEAAMLPMGTGAIAGVPVKGAEAVLGAGPIRAYHGSPHDFDRFDLSKIGTGEGAQAYGHGLYFAENPAVAGDYKAALAKPTFEYEGTNYGNVKSSMFDARAKILDEMQKIGKDSALRNIEDNIKFNSNYAPDLAALQRSHLEWARGVDPAKVEIKNPGRMYEVNINADPAHFLDWDKPLSQQHGAIRSLGIAGEKPIAYGEYKSQFLNPMHEALQGHDFAKWLKPEDFYTGNVNMDAVRQALNADPAALAKIEGLQGQFKARNELRGSDIYHTMARSYDTDIGGLTGAPRTVEASEMMREAGIPGIKYLDQGSRAPQWQVQPVKVGYGSSATGPWATKQAGNPNVKYFDSENAARDFITAENEKNATHNYVVFDDKLIDIIKKYGMAGLSMMPPATAAFMANRIKPVDHDPFEEGAGRLVPVDHDPFADQL